MRKQLGVLSVFVFVVLSTSFVSAVALYNQPIKNGLPIDKGKLWYGANTGDAFDDTNGLGAHAYCSQLHGPASWPRWVGSQATVILTGGPECDVSMLDYGPDMDDWVEIWSATDSDWVAGRVNCGYVPFTPLRCSGCSDPDDILFRLGEPGFSRYTRNVQEFNHPVYSWDDTSAERTWCYSDLASDYNTVRTFDSPTGDIRECNGNEHVIMRIDADSGEVQAPDYTGGPLLDTPLCHEAFYDCRTLDIAQAWLDNDDCGDRCQATLCNDDEVVVGFLSRRDDATFHRPTFERANTGYVRSGFRLCCKAPSITGVPLTETCSDGVQNQDETDVDCGGSICASCPPIPAVCGDGVVDDGESCDRGSSGNADSCNPNGGYCDYCHTTQCTLGEENAFAPVWRDLDGNIITTAQMGDTVQIFWEKGSSFSTTFAVWEDDMITDSQAFDDVIRGSLSGEVDGQDSVAYWTITPSDVALANPENGKYEFYAINGEGVRSAFLDVTATEDDDPLELVLNNPSCGEYFYSGDTLSIQYSYSDADDVVDGRLMVDDGDGEFVLDTFSGARKSKMVDYVLVGSGVRNIILEAENSRGERYKLFAHIAVLSDYIPHKYWLICIDEPNNVLVNTEYLRVDASSTKGLDHDPRPLTGSSNRVDDALLVLPKADLYFDWVLPGGLPHPIRDGSDSLSYDFNAFIEEYPGSQEITVTITEQ